MLLVIGVVRLLRWAIWRRRRGATRVWWWLGVRVVGALPSLLRLPWLIWRGWTLFIGARWVGRGRLAWWIRRRGSRLLRRLRFLIGIPAPAAIWWPCGGGMRLGGRRDVALSASRLPWLFGDGPLTGWWRVRLARWRHLAMGAFGLGDLGMDDVGRVGLRC